MKARMFVVLGSIVLFSNQEAKQQNQTTPAPKNVKPTPTKTSPKVAVPSKKDSAIAPISAAKTESKTFAIPKDTSIAPAHGTKTKKVSKPTQVKKNIHRVYTDMDFDELLAAKDKRVAASDFQAAIKYYEQLLKICTNINTTAELMIEYADLLFDQGELNKARLVYTEYTNLYPGDDTQVINKLAENKKCTKHEYALHRAALCSFYLTLSTDRDQTMTQETLQLTENFLTIENYTTYKQEVCDIQKQCYKKIVDSELSICDFYLKQGSYKAVEQRLAHIKNDYLPKVPDIESDILALELELSTRRERTIVAATQNAKKGNHASKRF
jgi:outer membrane protein assembly factor BamD (BamD/ComL family)